MLKPRRRIIDATRCRTPGWFSTRTDSKRAWDISCAPSGDRGDRRPWSAGRRQNLWSGRPWSLLGLHELEQPLAEGHDRIDVGVGVDDVLHQHRALVGEGLVEH